MESRTSARETYRAFRESHVGDWAFAWSSPRVRFWAFWLAALAISGLAALAVWFVFRGAPVPPGGDPGNWLATARAYLGRPYPSQLVPFGYPPLTFLFLGSAVAVAGPIGGVDLFAAGLVLALGLSTAALASTVLRSRAIALLAVAFLLADPSQLTMFFWGAYPNLLGFVFLNLALVGLLRAGQGHPSGGAALFWVGFALAVLTHSLVAVVLAGTASAYLLLGLLVPLPAWSETLTRTRPEGGGVPGVGARALVASHGGQAGMVVFTGLVGGFYATTFLAGVPHPNYLVTSGSAFRPGSMAAVLGPLLPSIPIPATVALFLLVASVFGALAVFAIVRARRPSWLTAPAVLLFVWPLAVVVLVLAGFEARVVTDYRRFGFFLLAPAVLTVAYVLERLPGIRGQPVPDLEALPADTVERTPSVSTAFAPAFRPRDGGGRPSWGRRALVGALAVVLLVVVATVTAPALSREESGFTLENHDAAFLSAARAIGGSGSTGGVLTIPGADKWIEGLDGENAFAPYAVNSLLFYPGQQYDSELAYFSLSGHYSVTNGETAVSVRGTNASWNDGVVDYSAYGSGLPHETLRLPPSAVAVHLTNVSSGRTTVAGLATAPTVVLPTGVGGALTVSYAEPLFWFNVSATLATPGAGAVISLVATAHPPGEVTEVHVLLAAAVPVTPSVSAGTAAGDLRVITPEAYGPALTFVNVSPASAVRGLPGPNGSAGGAVSALAFVSPTTAGAPSVAGTLELSTPAASRGPAGSPGVFSTPAIWSDLGVRFLLWRNASFTLPGELFPTAEVSYLAAEYGLRTLYQNSEWVVLVVPVPPVGGSPGVLGLPPGGR